MVIILYGADTFRSREKLRELIEAFREKHDPSGVNVVRLDGQAIAPDDLAGALRSQPFFGTGKRLVVVERLLAKKGTDHGQVAELVAALPESTVLVLWEGMDSAVAAKNPVIKKSAKTKGAAVYAFDPLTGPSLTKWVRDEAARRGGSFAPRAAEALITLVGGDLWRIDGELGKLLAFRRGEDVRVEDVELLTEGAAAEDVFGILDALSAKDLAGASRRIRAQVTSGLEESYLLAMLIRQVRILTQARSYLSQSPRATRDELSRALGVHPFVAQKAGAAARAFPPSLLLELMESLFAAERAIKSGRISAGLAVEQALARIAG